MEKRRDSRDKVEKIEIGDTASEAFHLADDVRLGAELHDPDNRFENVYQPFDNPARARRLRRLAKDIENAARRAVGWPEV
jgi:hypothetical protein